MAKKRKVQSESPALVGPSQNRSAEHIEIPASRWDEYTYDKAPSVRCSSGTPSRPVFRGDADPYFPPNANAAITTFSGEMDFRLKFLCQADPIEADSLYKEAVQGLVNITLPPNILNQLCQDTILSQMQELGAQQYKIDRVSELIRREVVYKTSWLLANEMNTMEKVELGLATVIAATSRLHANKFDHEVLGEIIKGFQGLQNHLSGLQTSNFTSGASIQMPATEQCSRRQSAAVPNLPVNTEIKIEGEPIPLSEVCHKTEGQEHPYDDGSPRNKSHKPEIDTEQVNIKQEILTQSSGNIKSPPLTTVAWPDSPRGSRDRCHFSNSEDEYGSVNEEAMVDVLERTVGEPRAQSSATAFGEDSESESDDVGKTAMRKRRMLMQSLKRSPTPCIDLLYGTDPLSPMHTEIAVQKIMDEIDRRFGIT
ncbi:hypothetical protein AOQ84DRAFT_218050 [Glonium stellatum]|uniref:Uncharacterized protein n=1 Tax=Glonium stellatum TaxID=574774 RepID=A0A8E2EMW3_9PEZI|nr:hypothetical protein AOQ84DRAFT_218050 [Glonium stellatum]